MDFLLIPGINNTAATFDGLRAALPPRHKAQACDCPALPTADAIARDLLKTAPDSFVAVGHSFGGYVALAMLAAAPDRVRGVVLVNSNDWADSETLAKSREEKAVQAEAGNYAALADAASARAYHPNNAGRADLLAERAAALEGYGAQRYAAHMRASAARVDHSDTLKNAGIPILVVTADHDLVIPTVRQTEMAGRLGAAQVIIAQSGHMLPAEQPKPLADALTAWADTNF